MPNGLLFLWVQFQNLVYHCNISPSKYFADSAAGLAKIGQSKPIVLNNQIVAGVAGKTSVIRKLALP